MTKEEILAEAKIRYPIGTKYVPAHLAPSANARHVNTVTSTDFRWASNNHYIEIVNYEGNQSNFHDVVYYYDKWAPIVSVEGSTVTELKYIEPDYPIF